MKIPFFNYKKYCKDINYIELLEEVLETGYLIGGPFVDDLEARIQKYTGIKNCITVGNATDAMEIIFNFLKLPRGSNVLVPAHTILFRQTHADILSPAQQQPQLCTVLALQKLTCSQT